MRLAPALTLLGFAATSLAAPVGAPLRGFLDEDRAAAQREREARLAALLKADNLRDWMKRLSARPHALGQPYGRENAAFIAAQFRAWGYETEIEEFRVLLPTPRKRVVELLARPPVRASLAERALAQDASSGQSSEQLPVYNAYSIDGDVTAELVYVNYGRPLDYEELDRRGIDVKGRIVLARYGASWRGIKPKVAAERGAVGCLIYSDPRDDGFFQGDVYPQGAWRNEWGAQRGSVADMPLFPGDPLTPGVGATPDAVRLDRKAAPTLTKIPVLPISYSDALPLLKALGGPVAPEAWRGALPVTYHLGPGPARVHLALEFDWKLVPAYDVIARLRGGERPDQWIVRGNHHDAWVNGAADPLSGLVALMEEARAIGELARGGWRPKRTLVYAAWDGEEPGLLGSTEWVETHAAELREHAAVYLNTDGYGRGFFGMGGSHTLERFINQVARDVADPRRGMALRERERARRLVQGTSEEKKEARERDDLRIAALGSGSDYTPFLQHLGIASLNLGFGGEDGGGSYHSIYDSFDHFGRFGDPGFAYGVAQAEATGRAMLRLADADLLPLDFTALGDNVSSYLDELTKLTGEMRDQTAEQTRLLSEKRLEAAADPDQPFVAPTPRPPVPHLNLAPLHNAVARIQEAARRYEQAYTSAAGARPEPAALAALDRHLLAAERALTRGEGLPGRPWFKHQVYAPGFYTGYGVKTLPAVREAIEQRDWSAADRQAAIVAEVLEGFAAHVERAAEMLAGR